MRFREISSNRMNERFALYLSTDEALRLRNELGELFGSVATKTIKETYRSMHETLMQSGLSNELPAFESELLEERDRRKGPGNGKRAYNKRAKAGGTTA